MIIYRKKRFKHELVSCTHRVLFIQPLKFVAIEIESASQTDPVTGPWLFYHVGCESSYIR